MVNSRVCATLFVAVLAFAPRTAQADPITVAAEFTATSPIGGGYGFGGGLNNVEAQSFVPLVTGTLVKFDLRLERPQPHLGTGLLTAQVFRAADHLPDGAALGTQTVSGFVVPAFAPSWVTISGFSIPVTAGQPLVLALSGTSNFLWYGMTGNLYADGTISRQFYDPITGEVTHPFRVHPQETGDHNFRAYVDLGLEDPPAPTPEPGTLVLLALGGAATFRAARRAR